MLMLQRFDCKSIELAMLLEEPPYHNVFSTSCGGPWRADRPLAQAAMCRDLEGYAWLYVAYTRNKASTSLTKLVKVMSEITKFSRRLSMLHPVIVSQWLSQLKSNTSHPSCTL